MSEKNREHFLITNFMFQSKTKFNTENVYVPRRMWTSVFYYVNFKHSFSMTVDSLN